jgi:hypothetical protein
VDDGVVVVVSVKEVVDEEEVEVLDSVVDTATDVIEDDETRVLVVDGEDSAAACSLLTHFPPPSETPGSSKTHS